MKRHDLTANPTSFAFGVMLLWLAIVYMFHGHPSDREDSVSTLSDSFAAKINAPLANVGPSEGFWEFAFINPLIFLLLPLLIILLCIRIYWDALRLSQARTELETVQAAVTAQNEKIDRLSQQIAKANHASAAHQEHMAMVSHDMRTSLLGVKELLDCAQNSDAQLDNSFHLTASTTAIDRMLRLIESCDQDPKSKTPPMGTFCPTALLTSLPPLISAAARANGTVIVTELAKDMPKLMGDSAQIGQIVLNLLSNAVKFTKAGTVTFSGRLDPSAKAEELPRLVITVADTGQGIAPQDLTQIFKPRFRGQQPSGSFAAGSGLGLAIVKRLVDAMKGKIAVQSELGKGSTFTLEIPLPLAKPAQAESKPNPAAVLAGKRVLLVDDDALMLLIGSRSLQRAGALVQLANTTEDALATCQEDVPDVVVLDLNMAGVDAAKFARSIRNVIAPNRCRIIAFSGNMGPDRARDCLDNGFDAAMAKNADLAAALGRILSAA